MKTYQNELNFAKQLALKAGDNILSFFSKTKQTIKEDFTPVTEADLSISCLVNSEVISLIKKCLLPDCVNVK